MDEIITKEEEQKVRQQAIKDTFDEDVNMDEIETLIQEDDKEVEEDISKDESDDKLDDEETKIEKKSDDSDDRFDKILSAVQTLNQTVSTMEGRLKQSERRIGGITNELSAAKKAADEQVNAPTDSQMQAAAKTDESWDDLKKNFPDWAKAIEDKLSSVTDTIVTKKDLDALRESIPQSTQTNPIETELKLVKLFHPNWEQTVKTEEFTAWIKTQPIDIINKFNHSTDAVEAIDVLNRYNDSIKVTQSDDTDINDVKAIKDAREKRLDESVLEKTKHKTIKPKAESDMTEEELRAHVANKVFGKDK